MAYRWYNIVPDLPRPLPPPVDPWDSLDSRIALLPRLIPSGLLDQEVTSERYVEIPDDVRSAYRKLGRPTPLVRAEGLEKALGTPAEIYYKREDVSPVGSHKVNTAIPQAYYARLEGVERLVTETGAGQWGSALALGCLLMGLKALVYMTRSSYESKPGRVSLMRALGAEVVASPSDRTRAGRAALEVDARHPGSLGVAISEAVETVLGDEGSRYAVGSVMNFVVLHQTVIGAEVLEELDRMGVEPDVVVACVGGGSNFAGISFPMLGRRLRGEGFEKTRFVAVESSAAPKATRGRYVYEHVDAAGYLPMLKMLSLGRGYLPPPIHAAGLRYHGLSPALSLLIKDGLVEAVAYDQASVLKTALVFARSEAVLPAPETAHAIHHVVVEAVRCRRENRRRVILFCLSGTGLLDPDAYDLVLNRSNSPTGPL